MINLTELIMKTGPTLLTAVVISFSMIPTHFVGVFLVLNGHHCTPHTFFYLDYLFDFVAFINTTFSIRNK